MMYLKTGRQGKYHNTYIFHDAEYYYHLFRAYQVQITVPDPYAEMSTEEFAREKLGKQVLFGNDIICVHGDLISYH
jgi:hypothetical protein